MWVPSTGPGPQVTFALGRLVQSSPKARLEARSLTPRLKWPSFRVAALPPSTRAPEVKATGTLMSSLCRWGGALRGSWHTAHRTPFCVTLKFLRCLHGC